MRWLVDECVDKGLVAHLRDAGHEIVYMSDVDPRATDIDVMKRAQRERRLLLTEDKDFGDLVFRKALPVPGLILMRIDAHQSALKRLRLQAAVERFGDALFGRYTVVEAARFRHRPLRQSLD